MQQHSTSFVENPQLSLIMLKLSQPDTGAQSRMKDGQHSDPGDRIENHKYLK